MRAGGRSLRAGELPVPEWEAEVVRDAAREVLSRPEYRPPRQSLAQRAVEWVIDQLGRLIEAFSGGGVSSVVAWALMALAVAAVVLLISRLARTLTPDAAGRARRDASAGRTAAEWSAEADAHEAAGRWRWAVRARWRGLVAALAERGLLDEASGRTAGELRLAVLRDVPGVAAPFAAATDLFELVWYGHLEAGAREASRARSLAAAAVRALEGGGEAEGASAPEAGAGLAPPP